MSTSSKMTKGTMTTMMLMFGRGQFCMITSVVSGCREAWQMTENLSRAKLYGSNPKALFLSAWMAILALFCADQVQAVDLTDAALTAGNPQTRKAPISARETPHLDLEIMTNTLNMGMIWIEPGTYWRGSPPDEIGRRPNETRHQVTLTSGFWLGVTEVTQAQYEAVMGETPFAIPGADRPADSVPWYDWVVFCNRLSEREELQPAYRIDGVHVAWDRMAEGYRLPTEAEWEYACRAGTTTLFHAGNEITALAEVAWFRHNADGQTQPVGIKPANPWGLHDMHGNVWEWCWDWYTHYTGEAMVDPAGPAVGGRRVLRGGGWRSYPAGCRSAYRLSGEPSMRREWFGARLARGEKFGHE